MVTLLIVWLVYHRLTLNGNWYDDGPLTFWVRPIQHFSVHQLHNGIEYLCAFILFR